MWTASNPGGLPKTVFTLLVGSLVGACASIPRAANYDGAYELVETPRGASEQIDASRCTDTCWVMSARNDNYFEARVYVRGQRVATLPGMMAKDVHIPIARSMLDATGCMAVVVALYPDTKTARSANACPVPGSRLQLAIAESYGRLPLQLYLQDWRTK